MMRAGGVEKRGREGRCCRWERRLKVKEEHGNGVKRSGRRGAGEGRRRVYRQISVGGENDDREV